MLVNVQEWVHFSIFRRADDVTRTMSKGGGACECLDPPPLSGNPVSAPVHCFSPLIQQKEAFSGAVLYTGRTAVTEL